MDAARQAGWTARVDSEEAFIRQLMELRTLRVIA
jgi:hypothetical protein